ncbi:MAG TPA: DNA topoisomerase IB, partial [Chryseosolibacter sp.]|nr:DNA topoisomerase IB [Chryseosolibacter sp.]
QQETKFHRMFEFGKVLSSLRKQIDKDLTQPGFPESKIIATVIGLMDRTFIRVGSEGYEKLYGSYGLTTLKNNHVDIKGDQITFSFKGKKGIYHKIHLKSKKFAKSVRQCKAIPGKELFQYINDKDEPCRVDSGQVNQYLKDVLGADFTTKDFRTWAGTLSMLQFFRQAPPCNTKEDYQRSINSALQYVSSLLGNTVAVCRKYYVHPEIMRMYREDELKHVLSPKPSDQKREFGLFAEEEMLMSLLKVLQRSKVVLAVAN